MEWLRAKRYCAWPNTVCSSHSISRTSSSFVIWSFIGSPSQATKNNWLCRFLQEKFYIQSMDRNVAYLQPSTQRGLSNITVQPSYDAIPKFLNCYLNSSGIFAWDGNHIHDKKSYIGGPLSLVQFFEKTEETSLSFERKSWNLIKTRIKKWFIGLTQPAGNITKHFKTSPRWSLQYRFIYSWWSWLISCGF